MSESCHQPLPILRVDQPPEIAILRPNTRNCHSEICQIANLSNDLSKLYLSESFSDVILKVEGERLPAHKTILAARSEYFRAMFFGGMAESTDSSKVREVELKDTTLEAFKHLLNYIYSSKLSLEHMKEELVIEVLGLANKYGFVDLVEAIADHLKSIIYNSNLCSIFNISLLYVLTSLTDFCLEYADRNAELVLGSEGFLQLSESAVQQLISRDSFCAKEIDIFQAVSEWINANSSESGQNLLDEVRLPLISLRDLLESIRPTNLLSPDAILDAIQEQQQTKPAHLMHRAVIVPNVNIATTSRRAQVITGEFKHALLSADVMQYEGERAHTQHLITQKPADKEPGIVIELGNPYMINKIVMSLYERDTRWYSYFIEVSMDNEDWLRLVDYREFLCRGKQNLYFERRPARFIRIVGTNCTTHNYFTLTAFEALYTTEIMTFEPETKILIPDDNVATIKADALVVDGVSRSRHALINGETLGYDWDTGYTCHQIASGSIVIQLPQPYIISTMRLLLWDCDSRSYSYHIDVSTNKKDWKTVVDKTGEACRSWQNLEFEPVPVVFVRIVGTHNTVNEVFHCVHFECPSIPLPELVDEEQDAA
ncbi:unnamed protein product, partial [Mesorhabditis belari]|uniref:BTB domain-containing protein n=1 Tax=Mesorhabditis belari TaxID=2138241 RepID=A0AAF3FD98_9BILA